MDDDARATRSDAPRLRVRATEGHETEGRALAERLDVPFGPGPSRASVIVTSRGLVAAGATDGTTDAHALARHGVRTDLLHARPGGEPVVRAVRGRSQGDARVRVIDATAGWGVDAGALWRAGMQVIAVERDPLLAALLEDAVRRMRDEGVPGGDRFRVVPGDARAVLAQLAPRPEVVYLDPMYPRSGGAAKRRAAAWLRSWLDEASLDEEAQRELLGVARKVALRRVVVKRPAKGPVLAAGVTGSIRGKTTRFDIYAPG